MENREAATSLALCKYYGETCKRQVKCWLMKHEKKTKPMRRSDCAVACVLDIIGDRWTLLVVRDLLRGKRHFDDFLRSPEGIATNILSARLRTLCEQGLVKKTSDPSDQRRYPTSSATTVCVWANCSATSPPGASKTFPEREFWSESNWRRDEHARSPPLLTPRPSGARWQISSS